ncbi:MAG: tRNA (adenosine(37)-N6)-threonylcarbamoyltransferase complex dimerization subunit type 1 TsaB [Dehalococcoidia bacterium]|nr:MAG: tRNA (adenosine(37)-N6)-threonylcarbamoyltransferase complex dimerization subunit type 1 TsaB [Dehalococcoidia bacterium]
MTLILAIDAATAHTGLALVRDSAVVVEDGWLTNHNQTIELLPRLEVMLKSVSITLNDIDAVAVSRGPGSYNGVRVGIANAKGLAFALSKPLIGISTLEAEAHRFRDSGRPVWVVLPLGHDYAVAAFEATNGEWQKHLVEQAMTPGQLMAALPLSVLVVGELPERLLELLASSRTDVEVACEIGISRAAALGQIGLECLQRDKTDTAGSLQALYLRRPQITPSKKPRDISGLPGRGVIWDMDGVIIDSAELHFQSWRDALNRRGFEMTREQFDATFGRRNDDIIAYITGKPAKPEDVAAISNEKETAYRQMVTGQARSFSGVMELIRSIKESGFKQAVASSAPPENVELIMKEMALEPFIDATVDAAQVSKGKPAPEVFLKAAAKLGLEPGDCLVIEDAVSGVEAARRAGMAVIGVSNTHPAAKLAEADLVVASLEDVDATGVLELIKSKSKKGA